MLNIGIIGCGYWGPNHIRIFSQIADSHAAMCSDLDSKRLDAIKKLYPDIQCTTDYKEIFSNADIDAVVIASPTNSHFDLTKEALNAGKHVLCEKPLALQSEECSELRDLAKSKGLILLVGHIFVFNAGISYLKELITSGELGKIQYAHSARTNLGPFRYDVNALWDLAPHDISIFNFLFDNAPLNVSARGHKCLGTSLDDLAFATMEYPDNIVAHVHVSWLDPKKERVITIVGDKKMAVWDDLDNVGPIKIYDKHVEKTSTFYETYGEFQLLSREGSITIPKVNGNEPLKAQGQYFLDCISKKENADISDAQKGLDVVKTLCAIDKSMEQRSEIVELS